MPASLALGLTITGLLAVLGAGAVMLPTSITGSGVAADRPASGAGRPASGAAGQLGSTEALTPAGHTVDATAIGQRGPGTSGTPADAAEPVPARTASRPESPATAKPTSRTAAQPADPARRGPAPRAPQAPSQRDEWEDEVIKLVNEERRKAGRGEVTLNEHLRTAMRRHVEDMAENHYFSHTGQNGSSPWERARDAGYNFPIGENIAKGQPSPKAVVDAWMNSEGHKRNILNPSAKVIGVGLAYEGRTPIWGQLFGSQ